MPLIKSAIKKLRQERSITERNRAARASLRTTVKKAQEKPEPESLTAAFSALDKAVKRGLIKKGLADRTKSRLSKKVVVTKEIKGAKKATKAKAKVVTKKKAK